MYNIKNRQKYLELLAGVNDSKKFMNEHYRDINNLTDEDIIDIINFIKNILENVEKI